MKQQHAFERVHHWRAFWNLFDNVRNAHKLFSHRPEFRQVIVANEDDAAQGFGVGC